MTSSGAARRVLLVGLGATTGSALDALLPSFDVIGLIRDVTDETTARARGAGVPVFLEPNVAGIASALDQMNPDIVVVSSFNRIIGSAILERCPFVNVHYSPLPRGRGVATVNWAIINGDDHTSLTIHHLVPAVDAGGILFQGSVPIGAKATVASVYDALNDLLRENLAGAVAAALADDAGVPQDESRVTHYCARTPADGEIDWSQSAADIDRLVRGLQPPFAAFTWYGLDRLDIIRAEAPADGPHFEGRVPGRIVAVDRLGGSVDVLAGSGTVRLHEVSIDGDTTVPASTVIGSVRATLGLTTTRLLEELERLRSSTGTSG